MNTGRAFGVLAAACAIAVSASAGAEVADDPVIQEWGRKNRSAVGRSSGKLRSAGPRFGFVTITDKATQEKLKENNAEKVLTAYGWQFEYEYLNAGGWSQGRINTTAEEFGAYVSAEALRYNNPPVVSVVTVQTKPE